MIQDLRSDQPLIHEQGFHGVFQAPVALLPVAFAEHECPQGMEERIISLDDRPFLLVVRKRSLCCRKIRFSLAEFFYNKCRVHRDFYDLSPLNAFIKPVPHSGSPTRTLPACILSNSGRSRVRSWTASSGDTMIGEIFRAIPDPARESRVFAAGRSIVSI